MRWWWSKTVPDDGSVEELHRALEDNKNAVQRTVKKAETSKQKATRIVGLAQGSLDILSKVEEQNK